MEQNKKAVARIIESFIAVMMVMSVILIVLARQPQFEPVAEQELTKVQRHILDQVKENPSLRNQVLSGNLDDIKIIIGALLPQSYSFNVKTCPLNQICSLGFQIDEEVYVEEAVIAANLSVYDPTLLKLFFWETDCGNDYCESAETCASCEEDCGECEGCEPVCGRNDAITTTCGELISDGCEGTCPGIGLYCESGSCVRDARTNAYSCVGVAECVNDNDCSETRGVGWTCDVGAGQCVAPECTDDVDCSDGKVCESNECVVPSESGFDNILTPSPPYDWTGPEGPTKRIDYTYTINEINGISVTFNRAKRCWKDGSCDVDGPITSFSVPANGQVDKSSFVYSDISGNFVSITYFGTDVNNNDQEVSFTINFP